MERFDVTPEQARALIEFGRSDTNRIERAAHGLKGSICNFFAPAATKAAGRLEALARQGEVSRLKGAVDDLDREIARLKPALAALKDDSND